MDPSQWSTQLRHVYHILTLSVMYRWSDTREHGFYCQGDNGNDDDDEGDTDEDGNNDINRNYSLSLSLVPFHTKIVHPNNKKIIKTACGAEFSMFIDDTNLLYSFGRPEHGQLGHNTDGQYFVTSNKLAFYCEVLPRHVAVFVEKTKDGFTHIMDDVKIVDVSCGNNHTVRK